MATMVGLFNGLCFGIEDHDTKGKWIQDWYTTIHTFCATVSLRYIQKSCKGPLWEIFVEFVEFSEHSCTIEFLQIFLMSQRFDIGARVDDKWFNMLYDYNMYKLMFSKSCWNNTYFFWKRGVQQLQSEYLRISIIINTKVC
jgi:hypothetical protein